MNNDYVMLRQSIRALEAEIDDAYDEHACTGNSVVAERVGQHSPKAFPFMRHSATAPMADSTYGEVEQTTLVPNTSVGLYNASYDDTKTNTRSSPQGLVAEGATKQKRVAFNDNMQSVPVHEPTCTSSHSKPLHTSTPICMPSVTVKNPFNPLADYDFVTANGPTRSSSSLLHGSFPVSSSKNPFTPPPSYHSGANQSSKVPSSIPKNPLGESKPVVMPEPFDGTSLTLEDWLTNFEICCKINGWSEQQKCSFLAVKLRGAALHVYTDLPVEKRTHYASVVHSLRNRFDRSHQTELYKVQLRARVRQSGENLSELASAIRRLTNRAYPEIPVEVREDLAKDQFIEALDSHQTRLQIRRRKPVNLDEALTLAIEEETLLSLEERRTVMRQKAGAQVVNTPNFPKDNVSAATCTCMSSAGCMKDRQNEDDRFAELNKKVEDLKVIVESLKMRKNNQNREIVCWSCKKKGHVRANCPNSQNTVNTDTSRASSSEN